MLEFIVKYWIQWLLGLIALGLGTIAKHYFSLCKANKKHSADAQLEKIHKEIEASSEKTAEVILNKVLKEEKENLSTNLRKYNEVFKKIEEQEQSIDDKYCDMIHRLDNHIESADENYTNMFNALSSSLNTLRKESEFSDNTLKEDLKHTHENLNILQQGILNIQGKDFKQTCASLLSPDHIMTDYEYDEIITDHEVYKQLGGNHRGDELFEMVQAKYKDQISNGIK